MATKKSIWDKAELYIKAFNGVILATLTLVIGYGSQKVADSLKYGELTQKLLTDLSSQDNKSKIKRDLSLITLNRTIGDDNGEMIAEMAEVICQGDSSTNKEKTVAYFILKERDSTKAKQLLDSSNHQRLETLVDKSVRSSVISLPEATSLSADPVPLVKDARVIKANQLVIGGPQTTVFIQTNKNKEKLDAVKELLSKLGYLVPQVEQVDRPFNTSVRYFNTGDARTANNIAAKMLGQNAKWECKVQFMKNPAGQIPVGQIEVWLKQ